MSWHNNRNPYDIEELFEPFNDDVQHFLLQTWLRYIQSPDPLAHPQDHVPTKATCLLYEEPVIGAGTASYSDMESLVLSKIQQKYIHVGGYKYVMAVGNQQSFSRMMWLKRFWLQ